MTVPTGSPPRNRLVLLAVGAFMCTPLGCDPAVQGEEAGRGLHLELEAEITSADAPVVPSLSQSVLRTEGGRFVVSHAFAEPVLVLHDSTGTFEGMRDARGSGPGEFSFVPGLLAGPEGTILAFEPGRIHVFDQDLEHLETRGLERRIWQTAAPLPDGRIAVDDMHARASGGQSTVSILGPTGRLDRELLEVPDPVVRTLLSPASEGGFWALRGNGNRLERYGPDGELVDAVVIEGGSVAPWAEGRMDGEGQEVPRRPRYTGFSELGDGTFLLVAWVSPEGWTPGSDAEGGAMLAPATMNVSDSYDTALELVDATSGQVLERARVPDALSVVQGAPTLFHSRHPDGELGHVITRIWRAELGSR